MDSQSPVLFEEKNGIGWIRLNQPRKINALSLEMVRMINHQLKKWEENNDITLVCLSGEGEKGLCAGGDIRSLYDARDLGREKTTFPFFSTEYEMDLSIHHYPKPILVYMNGIVMGGGVGISIGCKYRIVTEKTKWSMPEMNIGFFPDVGASYFFNQMPGCIGRYLALTADIITAADVLYIGAADRYMASERWPDFEKALRELNWSKGSEEAQLARLLDDFTQSVLPDSRLAELQYKIDQHFSFDHIDDIIHSLNGAAAEGDEWASQICALLKEKSPTSVKVVLQQLREGKRKTLEECFKMELMVSMNFMESHDFYEGVRAVLVDKDGKPKWLPSTFKEVRDEEVKAFFRRI